MSIGPVMELADMRDLKFLVHKERMGSSPIGTIIVTDNYILLTFLIASVYFFSVVHSSNKHLVMLFFSKKLITRFGITGLLSR